MTLKTPIVGRTCPSCGVPTKPDLPHVCSEAYNPEYQMTYIPRPPSNIETKLDRIIDLLIEIKDGL